MPAAQIVVLDRDGVINHDRDDYVKNTLEWQPIEGSMDAIASLNQAGFRVVVATNQSGIGRGIFDMHALNAMHEKMHRLVNKAGGRIDAVFFCGHLPDAGCRCRKPQPGMIEDILARYGASPKEVVMIGDSLRDLQAVQAAGGQGYLVRTGKGAKTEQTGNLPAGTLVFDHLKAAAQHLIGTLS